MQRSTAMASRLETDLSSLSLRVISECTDRVHSRGTALLRSGFNMHGYKTVNFNELNLKC